MIVPAADFEHAPLPAPVLWRDNPAERDSTHVDAVCSVQDGLYDLEALADLAPVSTFGTARRAAIAARGNGGLPAAPLVPPSC